MSGLLSKVSGGSRTFQPRSLRCTYATRCTSCTKNNVDEQATIVTRSTARAMDSSALLRVVPRARGFFHLRLRARRSAERLVGYEFRQLSLTTRSTEN